MRRLALRPLLYWVLAGIGGMQASLMAMTPVRTECAVLLHGMGRTHHSMGKIEQRLKKEGYAVVNDSYASTKDSIADLVATAVHSGVQACEQDNPAAIHFITHSLGGILVRAYLQDQVPEKLGKIVMMAPPNGGSEVADLMKATSLYEMAMGPAGQALSTGADGWLHQLKPIAGEIGIIAGNFSSDPWFSPLIPGEDDGKVSVESTRLKEMKDFLIVDSGHTFIMKNDEVIEQIVYFLDQGIFNRN